MVGSLAEAITDLLRTKQEDELRKEQEEQKLKELKEKFQK